MKIKDEIIENLTKKVVNENKTMENVLQFIQDWGEYKKRKLYKLSDYEYKERIKQFKTGILFLQTNIIIVEYIINNNKKNFHQYEYILNAIMEKIENKISEKKDKKKMEIKIPTHSL
jgi:hypothetical protein